MDIEAGNTDHFAFKIAFQRAPRGAAFAPLDEYALSWAAIPGNRLTYCN